MTDDIRDRLAAIIGAHLPVYGGPDSIACSGGCIVEWEPFHVADMLAASAAFADQRSRYEAIADDLDSRDVSPPVRYWLNYAAARIRKVAAS